MKYVIGIILLLLLAGCSVEQRKNCAFCRFVSGDWVCTPKPNVPDPGAFDGNGLDANDLDANGPSLFDP